MKKVDTDAQDSVDSSLTTRLLRAWRKIGVDEVVKALALAFGAFLSWLLAWAYQSTSGIMTRIPVYVFFALAGLVLCVIAIYLFRTLYGRHDPLIEGYERDDVGPLILAQCALRVMLVILSFWATMRAI